MNMYFKVVIKAEVLFSGNRNLRESAGDGELVSIIFRVIWSLSFKVLQFLVVLQAQRGGRGFQDPAVSR